MTPRRWIWILLFTVSVLLLTALAASWNIVWVKIEPGTSLGARAYAGIFLGSLGFLGTLAVLILLFVRLLREMSWTQWQRDFLTQVSHELKTPLASMELAAGVLRSASPHALWDVHDRELQRLKREVDSLLESARIQHLARPQSIWKRIPQESIELENWIQHSWEEWKNILRSPKFPNPTFERVGEPMHHTLHTHKKLLELIFRNLLDNARKFAKPDHAPHVLLHTSLEHHDPHAPVAVIFRFEDQGVGFAPGESRQLFKRFERSRHSWQTQAPGSGIGLFLARKSAKILGGRLCAYSLGGHAGATFELRIPL